MLGRKLYSIKPFENMAASGATEIVVGEQCREVRLTDPR